MSGSSLATRAAYGTRLARLAAGVLAHRVVPRSGAGQRRAERWNGFFDRRLLSRLEAARRELGRFDASMFGVLNDKRLDGQLVFEYGTLVDWVQSWRGLRVLDVGTGRSTLPRWMTQQGARVVALDFPTPVERNAGGWLRRVDRWLAGPAVETPFVGASMLALPFRNDTFDLVTCLSVVEHLDTDVATRRFVPPEEQERRLDQTLRELVRVTRPGGHTYITTECCDYRRALTDAWRSAYYFEGDGPPISSAWPTDRLRALFPERLAQLGCVLEGPADFDAERIKDPGTWTHRGEFFSAISLLARKCE
jgi:SAM-dependent methyltransferase